MEDQFKVIHHKQNVMSRHIIMPMTTISRLDRKYFVTLRCWDCEKELKNMFAIPTQIVRKYVAFHA